MSPEAGREFAVKRKKKIVWREAPDYVSKGAVGPRSGAGAMGDRRKKRVKTRQARKIQALRDQTR